MSKHKHTPGPWFSDRDHKRPNHRLITGRRDFVIATCPDGDDRRENNANARLIAQVPVMLEALLETDKTLCALQANVADANKRDSRWDGMWDEIQNQRDSIRHVIAKATGATDG